MSRLIDLSHTLEEGMLTYPGLPAPVIRDYISHESSRASYSQDACFHIGRIELVANTGTYLDTPFHRYPQGEDLSGLPLTSVADLPGRVFRAPAETRAIDADLFAGADIRNHAVLVATGWDRHWRSKAYFSDHPYLTEAAAEYLLSQGAALVGIDSVNIDDMEDSRRPVHTLLLASGIPVVEHLCNLDQLPDTPFRFSAVPIKVKGMGTFPVRAYARIGSA